MEKENKFSLRKGRKRKKIIGEEKYLVGRGEEVRRKRKGRKIFVKGFFGIASVVLVYLKSHLHYGGAMC